MGKVSRLFLVETVVSARARPVRKRNLQLVAASNLVTRIAAAASLFSTRFQCRSEVELVRFWSGASLALLTKISIS